MLDLEKLIDRTLRDEPVLYDLLVWKIDGKTNEEIQKLMESHYGIQHNEQYFSLVTKDNFYTIDTSRFFRPNK